MRFSRRDLLRTGAASMAGAAVVGNVSAHGDWSYTPVSVAPTPVTDADLQDGWAFITNTEGLVTYDLNDPQTPVPGGFAPAQAETADNRDAKVHGDVAGVADNSTPGGVSFFDVSDPASPEMVSFYDAGGGVHNHFVYEDHAFLTQGGDMSVVDISDPANPEHVLTWGLGDYREDLAAATSNNLHDIYVQDDYCYLAYWDAGCIVADVTDPAEPRVVDHFGAYDGTDTHLHNAHYVQPTPDRKYTIIGAEVLGSTDHGGTGIYHTPALAENEPDKLDSIESAAGKHDNEGGDRNLRSKPARADPFHPVPIDIAYAPEDHQNAVRTAHNSDLTNDKMFTSWYMGGIRAYDFSTIRRGDPDTGRLQEIASFDPPAGDFYWSAEDLASVASDDDELYYTIGVDTGKGLEVLELTPGSLV